MSEIIFVKAREILDSRGNPTIETEVVLESGAVGVAAVPSGKSTGKFEAVELRDGDKSRFNGKGVLNAVRNVNEVIAENIIGMEAQDQYLIDKTMIDLDGTPNKSKLGANAILSVSLAVARAQANELGISLYKYLGGLNANLLPVPQLNILNGGAHADSGLDIQEFLILPVNFTSFKEAIRAGAEIYRSLESILKKKGYSVGIGDEGGFAPKVKNTEEALSLIVEAITNANYIAGKDIFLGIDSASSGFFKDGYYNFEGAKLTSKEMIDFYENLLSKFPIISIEDGLAEEDWDGWIEFTKRLGDKIQIIGDDLYVTNIERFSKGVELKATNSILIKLNQIGTLSETLKVIQFARFNGFNAIVSHRSGETADAFISHLVVGMTTGQIKSGAPARMERVEKYNELIRIEEELGENARFAGINVFKKFLK
ncbi:phosphopyruvate hydratase [Caldisericum exile]|uniref:Enolase n=1 Tax=Caldisericum exile (strain DSM 21853 / NBRC 104410 / AZM16c01) TaxID=511051 RepID=A0A7U6GEM0_CALEA|nr:phosphopyruvate hydratase [Caldisericum exile]BAL80968.1 enolase [Caldisericum exile AZM16c01]